MRIKRSKVADISDYDPAPQNNCFKLFLFYSFMCASIVIVVAGTFLNTSIDLLPPYVFGKKSYQKEVPQYDEVEQEFVVVCYYNSPNYSDPHQLLPQNLNPHLCSHINVAFAYVKNKTISIDQSLVETLERIVKLKDENSDLKILLSIGGANSVHDVGFSEMVVNHASRKVFIKSIKQTLREFKLDGIDLDWEFPAMPNNYGTHSRRERQHFSQLLREIRAEYIREKKNYLLTVAAGAPESIVNVSYDVDQLNMYTDFVNVMTYDFHFFTKLTPFTGLNSPLYARSREHFVMAKLNINYTVNMFIEKGLDPKKIVVGIPTYGHSFTLVNADNSVIGSPASGYGSLGGNGYVLYPDICMFLQDNKSNATLIYDDYAKVPYLYQDKEWVSFDTPYSVREKAKYIKNKKLHGAMIYSLSADDHKGVCTGDDLGLGEKFPLSHSVKNVLNMN